MKALMWKELRENIRWLPVGLFVIAVICYMSHPSRNGNDSLLATALVDYLVIVAPLLAFALGVVQAYRDLQPAAGAYLNHRCVTASDVFLAKVFSGFVLYTVSVSVPLVVLAAWIAYQGMWFYPMRPAQVVPGLVFAIIAFGIHPAAMLMLSRDASWWGTRLFPLVPAGAVLVPFYAYLISGGLYWAFVCFGLALPTLAWLVGIARQGWQELSSDPPASIVNPSLRRRWLLPAYILVGATMCLFFAVMFAIATVESVSQTNVYVPFPYMTLAVEEGLDDLWLITQQQEYDSNVNSYAISTIGGENVTVGAKVNAKSVVAKSRVLHAFRMMVPLQDSYYSGDGFFTAPNAGLGTKLYYTYDSRGYLIGYERYPQMRWVKTIAADGVHPAGELSGRIFQRDPLVGMWSFAELVNAGYPAPLIDSDCISFIVSDPLEIREVIALQTDGVTLVPSMKGEAPRLVVRSGTELHEFKLIDQSGVNDWYNELAQGMSPSYRAASKKLRLEVEFIRKYTLPVGFNAKRPFSLAWTPRSLLVSAQPSINAANSIVHRLLPDKTSETITFSVDAESLPEIDEEKVSHQGVMVMAGMIPGVVFVFGLAVVCYLVVAGEAPSDPIQEIISHPIMTGTFIVTFAMVTVLTFWLARRAANRRGLTRRQTALWCWSVLLLGLAAPLSIIAMYRRVYREPCPKCTCARRVDTSTCEHCGAQWEPPASEGIEISDRLATIAA